MKAEDIRKLITKHGETTSMVIAMEELAELIQAVSKLIRYGNATDVKENLTEEMADAIICMQMIQTIAKIKTQDISDMIRKKMERNLRRV